LLLALVITAASVQDTNGGKEVADQLAAAHPAVTAGWVDGGYKTGFLEHAADAGIAFQVVPKDPDQKGFAPLPRRWAVERTFGWLVLHRAACPRLRDSPGTFRHDDLLGDDRQHEQAADRRKHSNLARRPRRNRRTITDLDQMPSESQP
jgi:transposase